MRHKIKVLFFTVAVLIMISGISAYAAHNAYDGAIFFHNMDSYEANDADKPNINAGDQYIGNTKAGARYIFKDVDFGQHIPIEITVSYGLPSEYTNSVLSVAIDNASNVIGNVNFKSTGGWGSFDTISAELSAAGVTGVHDVIFIPKTTPVGNLRSFEFTWMKDKATGPDLSLITRFGGTADSVKTAKTIKASASVDRDMGNTALPEDMALITAVYDEGGAMTDIRYDEKTVNDCTVTAFEVPEFSNPEFTKDGGNAAAFLWNKDLIAVNPADIVVQYEQGTVSGSELTASVTGAKVKISGEAKSENVTILVVPKGAEKSWTSAVQVWESEVADESFEYTFKMKDGLPGGDYTVYVTGEKDSLKTDFSFISPGEWYQLLNYLSTETDASLTVDKLSENAGILGFDDRFFSNLTAENISAVNNGVKGVFSAKPLIETDDYTKWIEALQKAVIPDLFAFYINHGASATVVVELISEYAEILGIYDANYKKLFTDDNNIQIAEVLIKNPPSDGSYVPDSFKDALIIGTINSAGGWGNVDSVLTAYADDIGISMGVYKNLSNANKAKVCEEFFDKGFITTDEVKTFFERVIDGYKSEVNINDNHPLMWIEPGETIVTMKVWQEEMKVDEAAASAYKGFSDLGGYSWAEADINALASAGLVKGKSETEFAPGDGITREEFAALIMRIFGFGDGDAKSLTFADTDKNAWYASQLAGAVSSGVVKGVSETEFGTGQNITRQDIAVMIIRAVDMSGKLLLSKRGIIPFTDSGEIADYAYDSVVELSRAEVINGVSEDKFAPNQFASRAEAVVMLSRVIFGLQ